MPEQQPEQDHAERLDHRAVRHHHRGDQAEHHQGAVIGRTELLCHRDQRRRGNGDQHGGDAAGEERADRRDGEGGAGASLPRHLIAVQAGHHRGTLARQVDQDGGGRSAVLRAVVDAGEHDQRALRRQVVGDRQQQRHGRHRADPGQHADGGADDRADQAPAQVLQGQRDAEPEGQVAEQPAQFHGNTLIGISRPQMKITQASSSISAANTANSLRRWP